MPASGAVVRIVAADANILINFIHLQRLDLLGHLPEYEFVMPEEVRGEITDPNQDAAVRDATDAGILRLVVIEDVQTLTLFAELTGLMGRGEAACLSLAITKNWRIASDEKRTFRREAVFSTCNGAPRHRPPDKYSGIALAVDTCRPDHHRRSRRHEGAAGATSISDEVCVISRLPLTGGTACPTLYQSGERFNPRSADRPCASVFGPPSE
jgi:predicted nucleic acid-binding protein